MTTPKVKCPICGKPVKLSDADAPFCSPRCREIDLGNWASEKYVISTPRPAWEQEEDESDSGGHDRDGEE